MLSINGAGVTTTVVINYYHRQIKDDIISCMTSHFMLQNKYRMKFRLIGNLLENVF